MTMVISYMRADDGIKRAEPGKLCECDCRGTKDSPAVVQFFDFILKRWIHACQECWDRRKWEGDDHK